MEYAKTTILKVNKQEQLFCNSIVGMIADCDEYELSEYDIAKLIKAIAYKDNVPDDVGDIMIKYDDDYIYKPKYSEDYWYVDSDGTLQRAAWQDEFCDFQRLICENVFRHKKQAQRCLDYINVLKENDNL